MLAIFASKTAASRLDLLMVMLFCLLMFGCSQSPGTDADASTDAKPDETALKTAHTAILATPEAFDPQAAKEIVSGDTIVVQAIGQARKGPDLSLSRQTAGNRARQKILDFIIQQGHVPENTRSIEGVSIEKTWTQDRRVFAKAILPLSDFIHKKQNIEQDGSSGLHLQSSQPPNQVTSGAHIPGGSPMGGEKP